MTLAQLLTEFFAMGFDYLNDGTSGAGTTRVTRWINQSYAELCDMEDWPFLEATATGTTPLTISDLDMVISVIDSTSKITLTPIDQASLSLDFSDFTTAGAPFFYYITGGSVINVYPTSTSDSLTVRYYKNPTDLVNTTDTPVVPTQYHDIIVLGAVRRALLDDADGPDIQLVKQELQDRLAVMRQSQLVTPQYQTLTYASEDW